MSKSSGFSSAGGTQRIIDAARSPGWSIGEGRSGQIMATCDSGDIGLPWVVTATKSGRGMRVSLYRPATTSKWRVTSSVRSTATPVRWADSCE